MASAKSRIGHSGEVVTCVLNLILCSCYLVRVDKFMTEVLCFAVWQLHEDVNHGLFSNLSIVENCCLKPDLLSNLRFEFSGQY